MLRFGVLRYVGGVILTPRSNCVLVLGPYMLASRSAFTETNTDIAGSWGWCCFSFDCVIPMMYLFAVAFMVFLFFGSSFAFVSLDLSVSVPCISRGTFAFAFLIFSLFLLHIPSRLGRNGTRGA